MNPVILQAGVDINDLAILGVGAVIVVMILSILAQVGLSYLAQRNLNDQLSLGMQAIVGSNNLRVVDAQQDDFAQREPRRDRNGRDGNNG